jgi:hypothetical protein
MTRISFLSALALSGLATAQTASPLKIQLEQALVTTVKQDGKVVEQLVALPPAVRPGDVLQQTATVRNVGRSAAGANVVVPVPNGTGYGGRPTAASARWKLVFSADGGKTFASEPLKQTVTTTENGKTVTREVVVPPSRYTHVRWNVGSISPDETLKFNFRVQVK